MTRFSKSRNAARFSREITMRARTMAVGSNLPSLKQRRGIWAHMRKCQNDVFADDGYIELSVTKNLRDVIWVCYRKLLRWIGHR
jgi:hypothetical protein